MHWKKSAVLAPLSVLALTALVGCGGSDDSGSSSSSSSSSSSAPASAVASTGAAGGQSAGASSSPSGSAAASTAKGYQSISAPGNGITLEVPKDFVPMKEKSPTAEVQYAGPVDAGNAKDGQGFAPNVLVSKQTVPTTDLPSQEDLAPAAQNVNGKVTGFEKISTAGGQGVQMDYTGKVKGISVRGALLVVPNGKGGLSMVAVTTTDAQHTQEISKKIAETVKKS